MTFSEDDYDRDSPLERDLIESDDQSLPEMMCPNCRGAVAEDTQKCPHCGDWITAVDPPSRDGLKRWVFIAVVLLMLLAMLAYVIR